MLGNLWALAYLFTVVRALRDFSYPEMFLSAMEKGLLVIICHDQCCIYSSMWLLYVTISVASILLYVAK